MKFLCKVFGHHWGMFICLRCKEIRPEWIELWKLISEAMEYLADFWMELEAFKEKRDQKYEEMRERPETTGEILKRLGIRREKPVIKAEKPKIIVPIKVTKEPGLYNKWKTFIENLEKHEIITIDKNCYHGKIRGMDILLEARKDFKRLGIPVEVKLMGDYGTIKLLSGPCQGARSQADQAPEDPL